MSYTLTAEFLYDGIYSISSTELEYLISMLQDPLCSNYYKTSRLQKTCCIFTLTKEGNQSVQINALPVSRRLDERKQVLAVTDKKDVGKATKTQRYTEKATRKD